MSDTPTLAQIRTAARRVTRCREMALRTSDGFAAPRGEREQLSVDQQITNLRRWGEMIEELSVKVSDRIRALEGGQ